MTAAKILDWLLVGLMAGGALLVWLLILGFAYWSYLQLIGSRKERERWKYLK